MFVTLYPIEVGFFLIIEDPNSPVIYSNQTHGVFCNHPEVRGVLVPVKLGEHIETKFADFEYEDISNDELLEQLSDFFFHEYVFEIDEERANKSGEAWLWLIGKKLKTESLTSIIQGFPNQFNAVLTWDNSD